MRLREVFVFLLLSLPGLLLGQDSPLTMSQGEQILEELRQIRRLLEAQAMGAKRPLSPTKLSLETKGRPVLGSPNAPVTIVEFTDYECPACRRFHVEIFPLLKRDFIDTGKVRFVAWDLPLTEIHPGALPSAQAARCAGDERKFWQFRDKVQAADSAIDRNMLVRLAEEVELAVPAFRACLDQEKYASNVKSDRESALALGVEATPSFVIGRSTATGVDGELVTGSMPYPLLSAKLRALIAAEGPARQ